MSGKDDSSSRYKVTRLALDEEKSRHTQTKAHYQKIIADYKVQIEALNSNIKQGADELEIFKNRVEELQRLDQENKRQIQQDQELITQAQNAKEETDQKLANLVQQASIQSAETRKMEEDISELRSKLQTLQREMENKVIDHANLISNVRTLESNLDQAKNEVQSQKDQVSGLQSQIVGLENEKREFERKVQMLNDAKEVLQKSNEQLQQELIDNQVKKVQGEGQVSYESQLDQEQKLLVLESSKKRLEGQVQHFRDLYQVTQYQYEILKKAQEEQHKQVIERGGGQEEYTQLKEQIAQLNLYRESNVTLRSEKQSLQDRLDQHVHLQHAAESTSKELQGKNELLEKRIGDCDTEIKGLKTQLETWQHKATALQDKYKQVDIEEYERLKAEVESLQKESTELKNRQQERQRSSQTEAGRMQRSVQQLTNEKTQLSKQIEDLRGEVTQTQEEIAKYKKNNQQMKRFLLIVNPGNQTFNTWNTRYQQQQSQNQETQKKVETQQKELQQIQKSN
eukprot:TRINITY_DN2513_c0_g1_i3.p1 TRINITY_DN2513_c0_g1~~TRINITY_DN2513_c0_g1_i3.p1  ORF type:complete len:531 (-),score=92.77 TRINITY_DN2513_c0_g1_i3:73-1605(-)